MENCNEHQRELLEKLKVIDTNLIYYWDKDRKVLSSVRGKLNANHRDEGTEPSVILKGFLDKFGSCQNHLCNCSESLP